MTKFIYLMTIIVLLATSCSSNQGFEGYRYNPFQYPYPEYFLKAKSIPINNENPDKSMVKLAFFGLSSYVPEELFNVKTNKANENKIIYKTDGKVLIIHRDKDNLLGCADKEVRNRNEDFCSAFSSTREFYNKLFTLTPEDLKINKDMKTGDKWIIHRKGFMFENVSKLHKYVGKDFVAFECIYKNGGNMTKDMTLFMDKTYPYYFTFTTNLSDDSFFRKLLENLQE